MARTLYLDCFSGVSGDMVLGALLDLGLPIDELRSGLGSLAIDYGGVSARRVLRAGVSATKFSAHADRSGMLNPGRGETQKDASHRRTQADESHRRTQKNTDNLENTDSLENTDNLTRAQSPTPRAQSPEAGAAADHHQHHEHDHTHGRDDSHDHGPGGGSAAGHHHHSLKEIAGYIGRSALSAEGKDRANHMFRRLAEAEAAIHDTPIDQVHLHEVGAVDSIVDIVGAVFGMERMGAIRVLSSPLNVGSGSVVCAHGTFPVPAPATARLLKGVPIYAGPIAAEMVTPTGALIVTEYASTFGPLPALRVESIGYGAGTRELEGFPNVLRMFVGETSEPASVERILTIECEIDDMNPQLFGPLMDRLTAAGALDVFYAPVQMKKNRPGTLVTAIAPPERREAIAGVLFTDTTTIGVRYQEILRDRLDRTIVNVDTPLGGIRFKVASRNGEVLNASPEFDDCARVATDRGLPIKHVQAIAMKAWLETRQL